MSKRLEQLKDYFINPEECNQKEFGDLSAEAIRVMAEIYATGGQMDRMSAATRSWLCDGNRNTDSVRKVIAEVLERESRTRLFDHKFMGQMHPSGSKVGILANLIGAYMNTNTIVQEVSSAEHGMELEATRWLLGMFGFDKERGSGNITSGGTTANIAALWVARQVKMR